MNGVFRDHRAELIVTEAGPVSFEMELTAASIDTFDETRDHLLRTMDYLDVESFPTIRYFSDDIALVGTDRYRADGQLAVNGLRHQVIFEVEARGPVTAPGGHEAIVIESTGCVSRSAFGMREASDPGTRAQPDADLILVASELTMLRRLE